MSPNQNLPPDSFRRLMSRVGFVSTGQLAEFMGVRQSSASRWMTDGAPPPVALMLQIMNARGWKPEDRDRIVDAEPHGEEVLREVATEFFDSEDGHEVETVREFVSSGDRTEAREIRWLPEVSDHDALDYLMRFARFVLSHPAAFR